MVDQVIKIPVDWVIDGVEVYYGGSSSNKNAFRLPSMPDMSVKVHCMTDAACTVG